MTTADAILADNDQRAAPAEVRMRAIDLYCGAGGATRGLQMAGFHVTGVDIARQPRYCGDAFVQADALRPPFDLSGFDFIWASPPCQAHTSMRTMHNAKAHADLIPPTRAMLIASGRPWVIENVPGAPLRYSVMLCGTMFGLGHEGAELRRHRLFETSFPILAPACSHGVGGVIGVYGGHVRDRRRTKGARGRQDHSYVAGCDAMDIDWMTLAEMSQAIPPSYSEFIARAFLAHHAFASAQRISDTAPTTARRCLISAVSLGTSISGIAATAASGPTAIAAPAAAAVAPDTSHDFETSELRSRSSSAISRRNDSQLRPAVGEYAGTALHADTRERTSA